MIPEPNERAEAQSPDQARQNPIPSMISADLKVVGDLYSRGDLQIDGRIEGNVQSRSLTVGEKAKIEGSIKAEQLTVNGSVEGEIHANEVKIARSAKVSGDVMHHSLEIESGAFIEGRCQRIKESPAKTAVKPTIAKPIAAAPSKASGSG